MPNPTTPAVDVAEGRRLWENAKAALAAEKAYEISNVQCYETVALYQAWAFDNAEALLTAASERDAAVREVGELREALLGAEKAVQAAFGQADAEFRDHDKRAAKHEATIREWRTQRDAALASAAPGGAK